MLAKSMLVLSLVYHKRQIDVLAPPAGLAMCPVNAAGAVLARSANAAGGLDIHSVNAASAASYAQTECKEAATAAQSGRTKGSYLRSDRT